MTHIVKHCPQDALNKFEEVSYLLKHKDSIPTEKYLLTHINKLYASPADEETKKSSAPLLDKSMALFSVAKKTKNEEGEEVEDAGA
jgi:hypothetical protein